MRWVTLSFVVPFWTFCVLDPSNLPVKRVGDLASEAKFLVGDLDNEAGFLMGDLEGEAKFLMGVLML